MSTKVIPSKRLGKRIQQLASGQLEADDLLAEIVVDPGAQKILKEGLEEAEVDEFLSCSGASTAIRKLRKGIYPTVTPRKVSRPEADS